MRPAPGMSPSSAPPARRRSTALAAMLALAMLPLLAADPLARTEAGAGTSALWRPPAEPWSAAGAPDRTDSGRFVPDQPATTLQPAAALLLRMDR